MSCAYITSLPSSVTSPSINQRRINQQKSIMSAMADLVSKEEEEEELKTYVIRLAAIELSLL